MFFVNRTYFYWAINVMKFVFFKSDNYLNIYIYALRWVRFETLANALIPLDPNKGQNIAWAMKDSLITDNCYIWILFGYVI